MKITNKDSVNVQQKDIELLLKARRIDDIPSDVLASYNEIILNGQASNPLDFVEFTGADKVQFFDSLDYIVDYDSVKDLSWTETLNYGSQILIKLNEAFRAFEKLNDSSSDEEVERVTNDLDLMRYKMATIKSVIESKKTNIVLQPDSIRRNRFNTIVRSLKRNQVRKIDR